MLLSKDVECVSSSHARSAVRVRLKRNAAGLVCHRPIDVAQLVPNGRLDSSSSCCWPEQTAIDVRSSNRSCLVFAGENKNKQSMLSTLALCSKTVLTAGAVNHYSEQLILSDSIVGSADDDVMVVEPDSCPISGLQSNQVPDVDHWSGSISRNNQHPDCQLELNNMTPTARMDDTEVFPDESCDLCYIPPSTNTTTLSCSFDDNYLTPTCQYSVQALVTCCKQQPKRPPNSSISSSRINFLNSSFEWLVIYCSAFTGQRCSEMLKGVRSYRKPTHGLWSLLLMACVLLAQVCTVDAGFPLRSKSHFTNDFAVKIRGGIDAARQIATKNGFTLVNQIFGDYYLLKSVKLPAKSKRRRRSAQFQLSLESNVVWVAQQQARKRVKRDGHYRNHIAQNDGSRRFRAYRSIPNDPNWNQMWYLASNQTDMGVQYAWQMGFTGKDVVVTILDDGLEHNHPDLKGNYDSHASWDVNENDNDPSPRYDEKNENRHGTRCAGEVAAMMNNNVCAVGVAFGSLIGGIRMLDGDVTDAVEAASLAYNNQHIDIYSSSWGPDDDGETVDGPNKLTNEAFHNGATEGRKGRGCIYVWASGNGGRYKDSCSADGYTNSIYTLSISSVTQHMAIPWYSEPCASTLVSTFSSGDFTEKMVITTDLRGKCASDHTGTSASAPIASGIAALTLEANPRLTWRDMQHIVVRTANPNFLTSDDWVTNGAGRRVSHWFGFGMMNASAMIRLARAWKTVPPQKTCKLRYKMDRSRHMLIPAQKVLTLILESDGCERNGPNAVLFLEHVKAKISVSSARRGDIEINLQSPMGTISKLMPTRPNDTSRSGFRDWEFMTTHCWGESSKGKWKLSIKNAAVDGGWNTVYVESWELLLYGTINFPNPYTGTDGWNLKHIGYSKKYQKISDRNYRVRLFTVTEMPSQRRSTLANGKGSDTELSKWELITFGTSNEVEQELSTKSSFSPQIHSPSNCVKTAPPLNICIGCAKNYVLFKGECVEQCPDYFYPDTNYLPLVGDLVLGCNICPVFCKRCTGPNHTQCVMCDNGFAFVDDVCMPADDKTKHFKTNSIMPNARPRSPDKGVHPLIYGLVAGGVILVVSVLILVFLVCKGRLPPWLGGKVKRPRIDRKRERRSSSSHHRRSPSGSKSRAKNNDGTSSTVSEARTVVTSEGGSSSPSQTSIVYPVHYNSPDNQVKVHTPSSVEIGADIQ